jgi:hypothetical protein
LFTLASHRCAARVDELVVTHDSDKRERDVALNAARSWSCPQAAERHDLLPGTPNLIDLEPHLVPLRGDLGSAAPTPIQRPGVSPSPE